LGFNALVALGWVIAAAVVFGSDRLAAGFLCLGVGVLFSFYAWLLSAHSLRTIPTTWTQGLSDGLNWIFFHLHFDWAVNPEWTDRTGHHRAARSKATKG
jgi:hypothetical protein